MRISYPGGNVVRASKNNNTLQQNIVWAVDPFHENPKEQVKALKSVQSFFSGTPTQIQPLSMLLVGRYNPEMQIFMEKWDEIAENANKSLTKMFKNVKAPGLLSPILVRQEGYGVNHAVDSFIAAALDQGADFLVVSSHARKGASRVLLGSFAETLILKSPLPVIVVNPKSGSSQKTKTILFPTDFSSKSKDAYQQVLKMARENKAKVLLFHKAQFIYPEFGYPFVVPPVSKESLKDYSARFQGVAEEWAADGKQLGVVVKTHICIKSGYTLDEINKVAKKLGPSTFIAMASQSGKVSSFLLGSLTRQVLRDAPCPVLVIHPNQDSLIKKALEEIKESAITLSQHPVMT